MLIAHPLEILSPQECWQLLREQRVGRVAFTDRALPAIRPLNYVQAGQNLVLRVAAETLGCRLDGQVVAFEVDEVDTAGRVGWSVVVVGTVRMLRTEAEIRRTVMLPLSWAGAGHQDVLLLTVGEISGRRVHPTWAGR